MMVTKDWENFKQAETDVYEKERVRKRYDLVLGRVLRYKLQRAKRKVKAAGMQFIRARS